jgi:hypothetical protein
MLDINARAEDRQMVVSQNGLFPLEKIRQA